MVDADLGRAGEEVSDPRLVVRVPTGAVVSLHRGRVVPFLDDDEAPGVADGLGEVVRHAAGLLARASLGVLEQLEHLGAPAEQGVDLADDYDASRR